MGTDRPYLDIVLSLPLQRAEYNDSIADDDDGINF
jgi:hypothetical protein